MPEYTSSMTPEFKQTLAAAAQEVIDWRQAFISLFNDVAACEAPEGTQVDDALGIHQATYNQARWPQEFLDAWDAAIQEDALRNLAPVDGYDPEDF